MELWQGFLIAFMAYALGLSTGYRFGSISVLRKWEEYNESKYKNS